MFVSVFQTVCEKYWPAISSEVKHGDLTITRKLEKSFGEIKKRILIIKHKKTTVQQFIFLIYRSMRLFTIY